jgi:alkylation response protein AidB-like acyl-CoA dehydrogenase
MQSQGQVPNKEASAAKVFGTEMMQHLYALGLQILGLHGELMPGSKWAPRNGSILRNWLSSFSATIAAGTSEIQRNVIATRGLGLPRG